MRLTTRTDLDPEIGEHLALRIGDMAVGVTVVDYANGTVTLEVVDSELMRPSRVGHTDLPETEVPAVGEVEVWVAA